MDRKRENKNKGKMVEIGEVREVLKNERGNIRKSETGEKEEQIK